MFSRKSCGSSDTDGGESAACCSDRTASTSLKSVPDPWPRPLSHCLHPSWSHCHHLLCCGSVSNMYPYASFPISLSSLYFMGGFKTVSDVQKPSEALTILKASQIKPLNYYLAPISFSKTSGPTHVPGHFLSEYWALHLGGSSSSWGSTLPLWSLSAVPAHHCALLALLQPPFLPQLFPEGREYYIYIHLESLAPNTW